MWQYRDKWAKKAFDHRASTPAEWPLLRKFALLSQMSEMYPVYLTGNPVIWFSSFLSLLTYFAYVARVTVLAQRGRGVILLGTFKICDNAAWFLSVGWAVHYIPYFLSSQQVHFLI